MVDNKYAPRPLKLDMSRISQANNSLGKIASSQGLSDVTHEIKTILSTNVTKNSTRDDLNTVFDITWGAKYLFMARIQGGINSPLDNYILPSSSISENIPDVTTEDIKLPVCSNFKIPSGKSIPEISVTLYDTEECLVEKSLRAWILQIHDGTVCGYIDDLYRDLSIYKLNYERDIVLETKYKVIPKGDIKIDMSSRDSSARELTVNFIVIDYLG